MRRFRCVIAAVLPVALTASILTHEAAAETNSLSDAIRQRVERLMEVGELTLQGAPVAASWLVPAFYEQRRFGAAWKAQENRADLFDAIAASFEEGLDPEDFHQSLLLRLQQQIPATQNDRLALEADLDILLTDAFFRLAYQKLFGKVDPLKVDDNWNFDRPLLERDPNQVLNSALESGTLTGLIDSLNLPNPFYLTLKAALARYRAIAEKGGWPSVPDGPALRPGETDPRSALLRRRLAITGDYQGRQSDSALYDGDLEAAVRAFQRRHGLEEDGIVGANSLQALNLPVGARIEQIRINLERARWVLRKLGEDFVVVNIAGFRTYLIRGGEIAWKTRSIVGRPYRKTPVFRDEIRYMDFNPTWTVPPGILGRDVIPAMRKDPTYLASNHFTLFDRNGRSVEPASVDWGKASARGFPYSVVQSPGAHNALGLVKFMFPNRHLVYLHDTPSRGLFARSERAFSSGCVRVENPFEFADLLLRGHNGWTREKIDAVVASGQTQTVHLPEPMPVLLLYWTAWVEPGGALQFRRDIYSRDGRVLAALSDRFQPNRR